MERAAKALHRAGIPFRGFRLHPDGSVDVLAGEPLTISRDENVTSKIGGVPPSDWDTALGLK